MIDSNSDFIDCYQEALSRYASADYEAFYKLAGITEPDHRSLAVDVLGIAGALYLGQMGDQADRPTRTETLKQLKRAQKASRDLADSLEKALKDQSVIGELMDAG